MIQKQDKFDVAISLADQFALINREMNGANPKEYHVPSTKARVEEYLLFFKPKDLRGFMSPDFKMANIIVRHHIRDSSELLSAVEKIQAQAEEIMGEGFKIVIASKNLMINQAASSLMDNMVFALPFEILVIFILVSLFFSNWSVGLLTLVPKLIPVCFIFGIMVIAGISLSPGTIMVAMIGIGIAVAETVHMFVTFNQMWRLHDEKFEALKVTMKKEIVPAFTTSISLILGFMILIFSNFQLVTEFGVLCAVSIVIALLCDLLVTPTLIALVRVTSFFDIISLKLQKRVLEDSPLFKGIRPYQVRKAVLLCRAERFDPNQQIIKQGQIERKMYLILEGTVEVSVTRKGVKSVLAILKPGQVFGEIGYLHEVKRTADVYALEKTELMTFNEESLTRNMRMMPRVSLKMNMNICGILADRLIEANAKIL
jgi:preprotein translocase subunit SecF